MAHKKSLPKRRLFLCLMESQRRWAQSAGSGAENRFDPLDGQAIAYGASGLV